MASHRDLKCWQRAQALAARIHDVTRGRPQAEVPQLVDQVRRSSQSIGANIAEGRGLGSNAQFRKYLDIALGSAAETDSHLDLLLRYDLLPADEVLDLRDQIASIRRLTIALKRSIPGK